MKVKLILVVSFVLWLGTTHTMAQKWDWVKRVYTADGDNSILDLDTDASGNIYYASWNDKTPVFPNAITMGGAPDDPSTAIQGYVAKVNSNGTFLWAKRINAFNSINENVDVFSNGNVAVTGLGMKSNLTFNSITYPVNSPTFYYNYVLLYDENGNELSAVVLKSRQSTGIEKLPVTYKVGDKLHLCKYAYDTLWYNNIAVPPSLAGHKHNLFHVVMNSIGQVESVVQLGEDSYPGGNHVQMAANSSGQLYLSYSSTQAANPGNGVSMAVTGIFKKMITIKFDSDGKALWLHHTDTDVPSTAYDQLGGVFQVALDENNNYYVIDGFKEKIIVGGQTYTTVTANIHTPFIMKINDQGQLAWFRQFPKTTAGTYDDMYEACLKYNDKGFLYGTGQTTGNIYFGDFFRDNTNFTGSTAKVFQYLVKIDTTGVVNRVRFFGASTTELQYNDGLAIYGDKVYVSGNTLQDDFIFDNNPLLENIWLGTSFYRYDAYLASYTDCNAQISKSGNVLTATSGMSYQWYRNGASITNETNQTYTPTLSGNYTVEVTFAGGCVSRSATLPMNLSVTGTTQESTTTTLSLFPNPASNVITLKLQQPGDAATVNIEFYNQQGNMVMGMDYPNWADQAEYVINITDLPQGIYHAKILCGEKQSGATFVKQ